MLARGETHSDLSTDVRSGKTHSDLSIVVIERRRAQFDVKVNALIRAAGIDPATWYAGLRNPAGVRPKTLARLSSALDALVAGAPAQRPPKVLAAFVRIAEAEIARRLARSKSLRRDLGGAVSSGRLRRLAVYVIAVELEVENAELARALCCSRQNVQQARNAVEDWREKPRVDALLDDVRILVRGE